MSTVMRIAYFSPLNPQKSGISDYSEELLPYVAQHAEIDLFVDDVAPSNREITENFAVHNFRAFGGMWQRQAYDVALYHMGNHTCHEFIYRTLLRHPGITVLHDYNLHLFVLETNASRRDYAGYVREMGYAYGAEGTAAARAAIRVRWDNPTLRYPLNERAIDSSLGLIVHNEFSKRLIQSSHPTTPVARVPHGMAIADSESASRTSLDIRESTFVVGTFGLATPEKRLDVVLRAFARFHRSFPDSMQLIVGEIPPGNDVASLVRELALDDCVRITGFVDKQSLHWHIQASDVCVNLRYPTCGETSGILLRCMAAAKPVIVSHVGSFAELPDGSCLKVFVDEEEIDGVAAALEHLAADGAERERMGRAAREYVRLEHDFAQTARGYVDFINGVLDGTCL
ncbi:MAG: glycosyltransferase family 4 protein [Chloroflexi bacterium]|nr:glycosyltransferase family 4 protein [Chloroflexota bacterium]